MPSRTVVYLCLVFALVGPARGFARTSVLPGLDACTRELYQSLDDDFPNESVRDLTTLLMTAERTGLVNAADLRRYYLHGTAGRRRIEFITYLTEILRKDLEVRALADGRRTPTPAEAEYDRALTALRKRSLAYGERHPDQHAALTKSWREATRDLSVHLLESNRE